VYCDGGKKKYMQILICRRQGARKFVCENLTSVDITGEVTTKDVHTGRYQNLASKNKCEENELGLK
jgi:hypothetical protein